MSSMLKELIAQGEKIHSGRLSSKKEWVISKITEESLAVVKGDHLFLSLVDQSPIHEISRPELIEMTLVAHNLAALSTLPRQAFRNAYDIRVMGDESLFGIHMMLPRGDDELPFLVDRSSDAVVLKEDELKTYDKGKLITGVRWVIKDSRKKSPGILEGKHIVLALINDDSKLTVNEISWPEWIELLLAAHNYAMIKTPPGCLFRIAYNGPGVGTRAYVHVHIILPEGDDELPSLFKGNFVERGDKIV